MPSGSSLCITADKRTCLIVQSLLSAPSLSGLMGLLVLLLERENGYPICYICYYHPVTPLEWGTIGYFPLEPFFFLFHVADISAWLQVILLSFFFFLKKQLFLVCQFFCPPCMLKEFGMRSSWLKSRMKSLSVLRSARGWSNFWEHFVLFSSSTSLIPWL